MKTQTAPAVSNVIQYPSLSETDGWHPHELERVSHCPVCKSDQRHLLHQNLTDKLFFTPDRPWALWSCARCSCAYLNPRPTPASIHKAYETYYTHDEMESEGEPTGLAGRIRRGMRNDYLNRKYGLDTGPAMPGGPVMAALMPSAKCRMDRSVRHLKLPERGARLLDIGSGNGGFVRDACSWGWAAEGFEPDPNAAANGRKEGLQITAGAMPNTPFPNERFAAVTMSHSIEHVHDPLASLNEAFRVLQPGGSIWIATPNLDSTGHEIFDGDWRGLEPPRHLVLFNLRTLAHVLKRAGFTDIKLQRGIFNAYWWFTVSYHISKDENEMIKECTPLPKKLEWLVKLVNWRNYFMPRYGEEIILTAKRPL